MLINRCFLRSTNYRTSFLDKNSNLRFCLRSLFFIETHETFHRFVGKCPLSFRKKNCFYSDMEDKACDDSFVLHIAVKTNVY